MDRPHEAPYAVLAGAFSTGLLGIVLAGRARLPERTKLTDLAAIALASHQLSQVLARDRIAVFLRAPFAEGPAAVQPKGDGMTRAVGELVTCPHCLALWLSGAFSAALLRFPRETRFAAGVLAAYALADAFRSAVARLPRE